jgi:aspartate aminotransferase
MNFSNRILEMDYSPVRKLVPLIEAAQERGVKVHEMHIGQPNVKTPDTFLDSLQSYSDQIVRYTNSMGTGDLRRAFAGFYAASGIPLGADDLLITQGGSEAIVFALSTLCDPGDEVLVVEPFYSNYESFIRMVDAVMVPVTTRIEDHYHLPARAEIETLITPRTRAILFSNPNNPTGTILTEEEMALIRDIALEHDLFIIADEVYRHFIFDPLHYRSFMNMEGIADRVVLVDSVSKHYSACGARIGIIGSANKAFIAQALKLCQARLSVSTIEQYASAEMINNVGEYLSGVVAAYRERRDVICDLLSAMDGVVCVRPSGAFYVLVGLPVEDTDDFAAWMLTEFSHEGETLSFAPGSGFYGDKSMGKSKARFSFCASEPDEIRRAMAALEAGLAAYKNR